MIMLSSIIWEWSKENENDPKTILCFNWSKNIWHKFACMITGVEKLQNFKNTTFLCFTFLKIPKLCLLPQLNKGEKDLEMKCLWPKSSFQESSHKPSANITLGPEGSDGLAHTLLRMSCLQSAHSHTQTIDGHQPWQSDNTAQSSSTFCNYLKTLNKKE